MAEQWTLPMGTRVCDVVAGSATEQVYVAVDDCVIVMIGRDIAARIPVGPDTKRLIRSADETLLYVLGYDGSVRVISTDDHSVTSISGSPSTAEVVSPDGRYLYTAHPTTARESEISVTTADGELVGTVATENYATGMDLSPDGTYLYVATSRLSPHTQYALGSLTVIDTAKHAVVDSIPMPLSPDTVTVTPDGSRVLVTHYDTNSISAIDIERRRVTAVYLPDAPLSAVVTPDGSGVYAICAQSLVAVSFPSRIAEMIPAGRMPRRMQFSPDGGRACFTDLASSSIAVLDAITNSVIAAIELDGHPEVLTLSRNGQWLYVADYWAGVLSAISMASVLPDAEAA
jgi:YVTN family beta-propeller protein